MPISPEQTESLNTLLTQCTELEARYYLLHLVQLLKHSSKSEEELKSVATALIELMENIKELQNIVFCNQVDNKEAQTQEKIQVILDHYATLVKASQDQGIFRYAKQVLWFLGYLVLGTLGLVFGGILGFFLGVCEACDITSSFLVSHQRRQR